MGGATGGCGGYDVPPTFAVCTPQGVQHNLCCSLHLQGRLQTTAAWPQKLHNSHFALALGNSASCTVCYNKKNKKLLDFFTRLLFYIGLAA